LAEYVDGEPKPNEEVANVEWVDIEEAEGRLKFKGDKQVFEKAKEILNHD
jgi:hypothetical protein